MQVKTNFPTKTKKKETKSYDPGFLTFRENKDLF